MSTISRFAKTSLLVLLAATLTTAAYARGGGHSGSNGPTAVQSNAHIGSAGGNPVGSKGKAHGCGSAPGACQGTVKRNRALDSLRPIQP
jgi:hypothetical protein